MTKDEAQQGVRPFYEAIKEEVGAGLRPFRRFVGVCYLGVLFRRSETRFTPLTAPSSAPPIRMIEAPEGNSMK
jgi:hypothetical protein